MRLIPAPGISTTEGNKYFNTISSYSFFVLFLSCNIFLFITTMRFLPAPEISTTEGKEYVSIIGNVNTLLYFYFVIFSD